MNDIWNLVNIAGFDLPPAAEPGLGRVLAAAVPRPLLEHQPFEQPYWTAAFFGLDRVSLFQSASAADQQAILARANRDLLLESSSIEQAGIGYMAKMVLLAESVEERILYGLFAADEASHLAQIQPFCDFASGQYRAGQQKTGPEDAFLLLLSQMLQSPDKAVLLFVLQVVLEGWGLSHYRSLAKHCTDLRLRRVLQGFLQAESRHHAAGLLGFQAMQTTTAQRAEMVTVLAQFLQMVRVGPQRLLAALTEVKGDLSGPQRLQVLQELDCETHSAIRLQRLKTLMQTAGGGDIVQILAAYDLFQPLPVGQCVNLG
jgi:hypothetical protein